MVEEQKSGARGLADLLGLSPAQFHQRCTEVAQAAKPIIEKQELYSILKTKRGPKKFIRFEGWQLLGEPLGLFAGMSSSEPIQGGYKAHGVLRLVIPGPPASSVIVSECDAVVDNKEKGWESRAMNDYLSKAGTRAGSKAYRMVIGWLPKVMGAEYDATPGEEGGPQQEAPQGAPQSAPPPQQQQTQPPPPQDPDPLQAAMGGAATTAAPATTTQATPAQPAEASTKEARARLFGMLAVCGFKEDDLKKAAFMSFCPGYASTKVTPEALLLELEAALKGCKSGSHQLLVLKTPQNEMFYAIADKQTKAIAFPKSGNVLAMAQAKLKEQAGVDPF